MRRVRASHDPGTDLTRIAERTRYVGSSEHKSYPSFAGAPKLRADASKCAPTFQDASEITAWLRSAIEAGNVGAPWEGDFPRYAWYRSAGVCYEARLVNRDAGDYKGYPLQEDESPEGM